MSRIGRKPVPVPSGVKVLVNGQQLNVEGPKGKLNLSVHPAITVNLGDGGKEVNVLRSNDERESRALHGLTRALVNNMVIGVSAGYTKKLEIQGVGYQAQMKGKQLVLQVGYANQIALEPPASVNVTLTDPTHISSLVQTNRQWANLRLWFARVVHQSLTRARVSVTKAK